MIADQNNPTVLESSLRSAREENEQLFGQLHKVQDELESLHSKIKELERARLNQTQNANALGKNWVDDELVDALAETRHLQAMIEAERKIHLLESQNALNSRLGNILIRGVDSPASLLSAPGKLRRIWRESGGREPPKSLGGKGFDTVIAEYRRAGFDAVEQLMSGTSATPVVQANAYTALARQLINRERANAAEAARRAYSLDPKPYRLKWLAFRLHDSHEIIEAEAMLDSLPSDMQFSDSEARQAAQLRGEAKQFRQAEAKKKTGFSEKRAEIEKKINALTREVENQARLAAERGREIDVLKRAKARLELEQSELLSQSEGAAKLAVERDQNLEILAQANVKLELEKASLLARQAEAATLVAERDAERDQKIETLVQINGQLQLEKSELVIRSKSLQAEMVSVAKARDEQSALASQRQGELLQLARSQSALEKEKNSLELRQRELERQLEQVTRAHDEQTKLVAQRIQDLTSTLTERNAAVDGLLKKHADDLAQARKYLDTVVRNEVANSTRQTQALVGLQSYYATGELPAVNSEVHSWPISQDFALYLVELIELNDYDLIVEFGSGMSTVIVAKALAKVASRRQGMSATRFVSFEHHDKYYAQTYARLVQVGLLGSVELVRAPLQDWLAPNGNTYSYYSCQSEFEKLAKNYAGAGSRVLVIVDGPPAATGKHARYPAMPLLLQHFDQANVDVLLDDYIRDDEKEIAKIWQTEVQSAGRACHVSVRKLEKDACLIATSPIINKGDV